MRVPELAALRSLFPVTQHLAYMNHAGVAPISSRVAAAIRSATEEYLTWGGARYERLFRGVEATRSSAAKLLGASPDEVAFVKNTSEGIALVAEGFPWQQGDAVAVPEGEFPANVYPWMHLERRGVRLLRVPMRDGRLHVDDFRSVLEQPRVRLLSVSSVEFETGFRNDLATLGQLCRDRGVFFFVDAIQSLGALPLDPWALGIHALAADGHKWLLGPEGAGILYLAREARDRIEPVEVGWNSVVSPLEFSRIRFELRADARRFECGSHAAVLLHGLGAALDLLLEVGIDRIAPAVLSNAQRLSEGLQRRGYPILSSLEPSERSGIVAFRPRGDPARLAREFLEAGVAVAARGEGIRLSPHFYNDAGDAGRFFEALEHLDRQR
jgi:selenocysteine lyase/cysteine desulfurase